MKKLDFVVAFAMKKAARRNQAGIMHTDTTHTDYNDCIFG